MPNPNGVSLDVRNFSTPAGQGYTNVTGSNGQPYSYRYTGGSDGAGNIDVTMGHGQASINVSVGGDPRYSITNITFNPADSQFTWHAGGNAKVAVIVDTAVAIATVKFTVIVADSIANCTVPCDPMIKNIPPAK